MDVKIIANILYLNNHPPIITSNSIKREEISKSLLAEKKVKHFIIIFNICTCKAAERKWERNEIK